MKLSTSILVAFAGVSAVSALAERFDLKVRNYFFAGFSGNRESLDKGLKMCEEALAADPKNAEALVWHGGGEYYLGGQAFQKGDSQKGMELVQLGMREMDDAVALAPDSVGVRVPRGAVLLTGSHHMPPEMARPLIEKGLSDYEHSLELQAANFDSLGTHPRGELLFGIAEGYSRLGNEEKARAYFERIGTELKDTPYAKRAATWMATKSLPVSETGCIGCHVSK
ncbi:MAG TPA: hypothetical protein VKU01_30385 [Bryobacteraceae bacterium]|nr:hypothetical protein [Bryobacteraceae bacterium]